MKAAETKMAETNHSRIVREPRSIERIRAEGYQEHRAMTIILIGVIVALLAVTALGIVGMASFWVTQRTKQIGTRRALGATRGSIQRYFMTENLLITSLGLALGIVLTYGLNYWLMGTNYEAQRLPLVYLAGGVVVRRCCSVRWPYSVRRRAPRACRRRWRRGASRGTETRSEWVGTGGASLSALSGSYRPVPGFFQSPESNLLTFTASRNQPARWPGNT